MALENVSSPNDLVQDRNSGPVRYSITPRSAVHPLAVEIFEGDEALGRLANDWNELYRRVDNARPSASLDWNQIWWRELGSPDRGDGRSRLVVFAHRESSGRIVAIAPFHFKEQLGTIGLQSAYPLGLRLLLPFGVLDHRDFYSFTEEPTHLIEKSYLQESVEAIAQAALKYLRKHRLDGLLFEVDEVQEIERMDEISKSQSLLFLTRKKTYDGSFILNLPQEWTELRNSLSKSMKDKISYSPRFITRSGHTWQVEIVREPDAFKAAINCVISLHEKRAQEHSGKAHNNYFVHDHQKSFLRAAANLRCDQREAFVALIKIDETVVGAQLFFETRGELFVTYSGFNPAFHKLSPLFVLICEVIKEAIERKVKIVNFLVSGEQHQTRWGATPRSTRNRYVMVRRSPLSVVRFGAFVMERDRRIKKREQIQTDQ